MKESLKVTIGDQLVGKLYVDTHDKSYHFEYDNNWIKDGFEISPHLPFNGTLSSGSVKRFLENLIPEGDGLENIANFAHISKNNLYALMHTIGYDTAGALMFGENREENRAIFRKMSQEELADRISKIETKSIIIWDKKIRLSLAGIQAKLPIIIKNGTFGLGNGTLSSTHIMKFQTKRDIHIVINELFCMLLGKKIGLNVAEVDLKRFDQHPILLVKRFDRIYKKEFVERLHIIDGCQILDLPPSYKYEQNFGSSRDVKHIREGASFEKLFSITKVCEVPAKAQLELLNWSMFNLIIGNSDAHGKNFSFFIKKNGISPTPFYDMLSILMYDFDHNLSMAFGDEFNSNEISAYQLKEFAHNINLNHKLVSKILLKQCKLIIKALEKDIIENRLLTEEESKFISDLTSLIWERANRFKTVALEIPHVSF